MLAEVLKHLNNWFVLENGVHEGKFTIENGSIALPFLRNGQYFRICGSVLNDGLYQYPPGGLFDEEFDGTIWALGVPMEVVELSKLMTQWQAKNGDAATSPYQSESFGGYSYNRATGASGEPMTVWSAFERRLNMWRKIR